MKQILMIVLLLFVVGSTTEVYSQGWLKKLGEKAIDRAEDRAKKKVEDKVNKTVDKTVDDAFGTVEGTVTGQNNASSDQQTTQAAATETAQATAAPAGQSLEMTYAKSDFVPGDVVIFEDNFVGEKLGEFPSQWELHRGNAEIAQINGENVILMPVRDSWIEPLMKTPKNYLGDVFTLEFDFLMPPRLSSDGSFELDFMGPNDSRDSDVVTLSWYWSGDPVRFTWAWKNSNGRSNGDIQVARVENKWYHVAVSFNKRALKIYIDGVRIANVPNVSYPPGWVTFWTGHGGSGNDKYIRNVRIAKGAVPLYDRMMTAGKFITYGITFDVGKSTIKPESMGEINRIVTLMNENPQLKFSVEGHTDSTGNAASNQTLSEARSKAIVDKLVELGIAPDRLVASGKGQSNPIADNATDEGRAKNRRVEFVKM